MKPPEPSLPLRHEFVVGDRNSQLGRAGQCAKMVRNPGVQFSGVSNNYVHCAQPLAAHLPAKVSEPHCGHPEPDWDGQPMKCVHALPCPRHAAHLPVKAPIPCIGCADGVETRNFAQHSPDCPKEEARESRSPSAAIESAEEFAKRTALAISATLFYEHPERKLIVGMEIETVTDLIRGGLEARDAAIRAETLAIGHEFVFPPNNIPPDECWFIVERDGQYAIYCRQPIAAHLPAKPVPCIGCADGVEARNFAQHSPDCPKGRVAENVKVESAEESARAFAQRMWETRDPSWRTALVEARDAAIRAEGYRAGLERAAEITDREAKHWDSAPWSTGVNRTIIKNCAAACRQVVRAIRAELDRPEPER